MIFGLINKQNKTTTITTTKTSSIRDNNAVNNIASSSWCTMDGLCGVRFSQQ
jgi:hypothetical protein